MQTYLGPLIAAIGILVSIQLYRLQKHKHLDWELESKERLLANSEIPRQRFDLSYNGSVVKDPYVATVWIGNRGRQRIEREDYDTPLRLEVEGDTSDFRFLGAEIVSRGKGNPQTTLKDDSSGTALSTDPLNQSDWLQIRLLTDGEPNVRLAGHIAEVRHFREVRGRGGTKLLKSTYDSLERTDLIAAVLLRAMLSSEKLIWSESRPEVGVRKAITRSKRTWIFLGEKRSAIVGSRVWQEPWTADRRRHGWRAQERWE